MRPSNARPNQATLLAFGAVVVLGGANAVAVKLTVDELAPFWGAALRFLAAGAQMTSESVALASEGA